MLLTHFDVTLTSFLGGVINCVKRLIPDSSWRCQDLQSLIIFTMILLLKWSGSSKIMQNMIFHVKLYSLTLSTLKTCRQMGEALPHDIPPMYSWYPSTCIMIPPDVLMISPNVLMVSFRCTEHSPCTHGIPPMY